MTTPSPQPFDDPSQANELLPLVYEELRTLASARLANEKPGHSLQPTALVHEAFARLAKQPQQVHWNSRGHFFGAAAEAMRRILVENARHQKSLRHGGQRKQVDFERVDAEAPMPTKDIVAISDALDLLAEKAPEVGELCT